MNKYLADFYLGAERSLEKRAEGVLRKIEAARRSTLGFESDAEKAKIPIPPTTLMSVLSSTHLPSTKPKYEVVLLPNAKVSPTIGIGLGGLQTRLIVKDRPESIPSDSVVGKGLDNQRAVTGGADLSIKTSSVKSAHMNFLVAGALLRGMAAQAILKRNW